MHKRTAMECREKSKVNVRAELAEFVGIGGIGCPDSVADWSEFGTHACGQFGEKIRERYGKDREVS